MSLMSALNVSVSALQVNTIGLQVVSNNISNVNTPGYARQDLLQQTAPTYRQGQLTFGSGVQAAGIVQAGNSFLDSQLQDAISDAEGSEIQHQIYQQLEAVIGELGENDLSTSLSNFFNALSEVANQPESASVRNIAVQQGDALAQKINSTFVQARDIQSSINQEVSDSADRINALLEEVNVLNGQIQNIEGTSGASAASPLRDTRRTALKELSSLINIKVREFEGGGVNINTANGEPLLFNGEVLQVQAKTSSPDGYPRTTIVMQHNGSTLSPQSGRVGGMQKARDNVIEDFLANLTSLSDTLTFEFNKLHSSGQGLTAFDSVIANDGVENPDAPLDQSSLKFKPENGSLNIHVRDKATGEVSTTNVLVQLGGAGGMSLNQLAQQLGEIDGLQAAVDYKGRLQIQSTNSNAEFYFSEDSSGVLAAVGINTFFTGTSPSTIGVRTDLKSNPSQLAVSKNGVGNDAENILQLAQMDLQARSTLNNRSLRTHYETIVGNVAQQAAITDDIASGFRQYADSIEGQALSLAGVNLDEEAVKMLQYQRAYQASARVVQTVNELFDVLVNL